MMGLRLPSWWRSPSRSSQAVAAFRAALERPHTPDGDPDAQARMARGMRVARGEKLRLHLIERTRFFDDQVLAAIADGVEQVVILGAGYDDRALRFRAPGVRYFELDHPATQADKRRRLRRIGANLGDVALAPADFRSDDTPAALAAAGHGASKSSLFICEGLLIYLDRDTNLRLLAAMRSIAGSGSRLAASLAVHPDGEDSDAVVASANRIRRNSASEPWRTILTVDAQLALLESAGWSVADDDRSAPVGGMLCVVARPAPP
jgi:methyltransferase (TIGR00027 family)